VRILKLKVKIKIFISFSLSITHRRWLIRFKEVKILLCF